MPPQTFTLAYLYLHTAYLHFSFLFPPNFLRNTMRPVIDVNKICLILVKFFVDRLVLFEMQLIFLLKLIEKSLLLIQKLLIHILQKLDPLLKGLLLLDQLIIHFVQFLPSQSLFFTSFLLV